MRIEVLNKFYKLGELRHTAQQGCFPKTHVRFEGVHCSDFNGENVMSTKAKILV